MEGVITEPTGSSDESDDPEEIDGLVSASEPPGTVRAGDRMEWVPDESFWPSVRGGEVVWVEGACPLSWVSYE